MSAKPTKKHEDRIARKLFFQLESWVDAFCRVLTLPCPNNPQRCVSSIEKATGVLVFENSFHYVFSYWHKVRHERHQLSRSD